MTDAQHTAERLQEAEVLMSKFEMEPFASYLILQVLIWSNSDCQDLPNTTIQSSMLCAGGQGNGTNKVGDAVFEGDLQDVISTSYFQGDSGGPLTVEKNGVHILEGVTSHGLSKYNHIKVILKRN